MSTYFKFCHIPYNVYRFQSKVFLKLKNCETWRGKHPCQEGFSKEDKEALNAMSFIVLAPIFDEELGIKCDMVGFPLMLTKRLLTKYCLWDSKPENKVFFQNEVPNFAQKVDEYAFFNCAQSTDLKFTAWLFDAENQVDAQTKECFEVAKAIATLVEFEEVEKDIREDIVQETRLRVYQTIGKFTEKYPFISDIVGSKGKYAKVLRLLHNLSWARYTFRWQNYCCAVRCSILTHMLESAVLGYFMFIEEHLEELRNSSPETNPVLYNDLEKAFTVMLFHDVAEIWTDDIPSPAKDGLGIREVAEKQELIALEKHFYPKLPECAEKYFRNGVMLEDESNKCSKKFYKSADYFSADLEITWNIREGARDERFWRILNDSYKNSYRTNIARETLKFYLDQFSDIKFFE